MTTFRRRKTYPKRLRKICVDNCGRISPLVLLKVCRQTQTEAALFAYTLNTFYFNRINEVVPFQKLRTRVQLKEIRTVGIYSRECEFGMHARTGLPLVI
jgi:hypothetical protein